MSPRDPQVRDDPPRLASYWESLSDGRVRCTLCPQGCRIRDGSLGACGVRVNRRGSLYTLVYDRVVVRQVDPIEKKPLYHFLPGSLTYSIATVGCPLRCGFCQNWEISQWAKRHLPHHLEWESIEEPFGVTPQLARLHESIPGARVPPEEIVESALTSAAASIAYTYAEPTAFFELVRDTAALAREAGLRNVFVTSGSILEAPLRELAPLLDGVNVDLKFFREESYRHVSRARRDPVLESIRRFHEMGVWTEVTTLVIPGLNDSDEELRRIAGFIRSVDPGVPWHVSRFHPGFEMWDRPPTPLETLRRARAIGLEAGLRFVYLGNAPGEGGEDTSCPACGGTLLRRDSYLLRANRLRDGRCPDCGTPVDGVGLDRAGEAPPVAARGGID
jgi:pyruvate formate lyase activating enzyme